MQSPFRKWLIDDEYKWWLTGLLEVYYKHTTNDDLNRPCQRSRNDYQQIPLITH